MTDMNPEASNTPDTPDMVKTLTENAGPREKGDTPDTPEMVEVLTKNVGPYDKKDMSDTPEMDMVKTLAENAGPKESTPDMDMVDVLTRNAGPKEITPDMDMVKTLTKNAGLKESTPKMDMVDVLTKNAGPKEITPDMDMVKTLTENAGPYDKEEMDLLKDMQSKESDTREFAIQRIMESLKAIESPDRFGAESEGDMRLRAEAILDGALQMEIEAKEAESKARVDELMKRNEEANKGFRIPPTAEQLAATKAGLAKLRETESTVNTRNKLFDALRVKFPEASDEDLEARVAELMERLSGDVEGDMPPVATTVTTIAEGDSLPTVEEAPEVEPEQMGKMAKLWDKFTGHFGKRTARVVAGVAGGALGAALGVGIVPGVAAGMFGLMGIRTAAAAGRFAKEWKSAGFKGAMEKSFGGVKASVERVKKAIKEMRDPKEWEEGATGGRRLLNRLMIGSGVLVGATLGTGTAAFVKLPASLVGTFAGVIDPRLTEAGISSVVSAWGPLRIRDFASWLAEREKNDIAKNGQRMQSNFSKKVWGERGKRWGLTTEFMQVVGVTAAVTAAAATITGFDDDVRELVDGRVDDILGKLGLGDTEVEPQVVENDGTDKPEIEVEEPVVEGPIEPIVPEPPVEPEFEFNVEAEGTVPVTTDTATIPHGYTFDGKTVTMPVTQIGTTGPIQGIQTLFREAIGEGGAEIIGEMQEKFDLLGAHINARIVTVGDIINVAGNDQAALEWAQEMGYDNVGDFTKGMNAWGTSAEITTWKFPVAILGNAMKPIN